MLDQGAPQGKIGRLRNAAPVLTAAALLIAAACAASIPVLRLLLAAACGAAFAAAWLDRRLAALSAALDLEQVSEQLIQGRVRLPGVRMLMNAHRRQLEDYQHTVERLSDENDMMVDRYEVLTNNLAAAIVIRDAEGKIAYCSPYTEVLTGFSVEEIYGCQNEDFMLRILHPDDREQYRKAFKVNACGEDFQFRCRFFHKTGIEMWAETRAVPIMDEHGEVRSSLSITFDITGLIRRQQLIEEKNRDLEDFSYMISHDLKAPIFTIKGMVQILEEDCGSGISPQAHETLHHIHTAVNRLEQLVQSVVDYSRINKRETVDEAVPLAQVLDDIRVEFQTQLAACGAELRIDAALPPVQGDRLKLYQIFSNLIGNAIKYRSPQRPLCIEVRQSPDEHNRYARILVRDNGLGIPAGRITDIFRPFQRAHGREIEGSGIGLACVKKLVTGFGGTVGVESKEGCGSEFFVTLPRAERTVNETGAFAV